MHPSRYHRSHSGRVETILFASFFFSSKDLIATISLPRSKPACLAVHLVSFPLASYFEDLIATAVAADAEANAPLEEILTEEERDEVARLREAVGELSDKYERILDSLRADEVRVFCVMFLALDIHLSLRYYRAMCCVPVVVVVLTR